MMRTTGQHLWLTLILVSSANGENAASNVQPEIESLYTVIGVFHHSDVNRLAAAVVYHRKGQAGQQLYWVGDLIDGGLAKLVRVENNGAYFRYYGDYYFISVDRYFTTVSQSAPRSPSSPSSHISSRDVESETDERTNLHRAVTHLRRLAGIGGGVAKMATEGMQMEKVIPGSLLHSAGLRDGDLVQTYNGQKIGKGLQVSTLIRALKLKGQTGKLGILRNGISMDLEVRDLKVPKVLGGK